MAPTFSPEPPGDSRALRNKIAAADRPDRYPLMDVVWPRFARRLTQRLTALYRVPVEARVTSRDIRRFGDCLDRIADPVLFCVFRASGWPDSGLMVIDAGIADANLEFLLGGNAEPAAETAGRAATHLDRTLARRLADAALAELADAFAAARAEIGAVAMVCGRIEPSRQSAAVAAIAANEAPAFVAQMALSIGEAGRPGRLDLILPMAMLEPVRPFLAEPYRGAQTANDLVWARHIASALLQTPLPMQVELERLFLPVDQVLAWKPGDVLPLSADADSLLAMRLTGGGGDAAVFAGTLGALRGHKAVKVASDVPAEFGQPLGRLAAQLGVSAAPPPAEPDEP